MRILLVALFVLTLTGLAAADVQRTEIPPGIEPAQPGEFTQVPCDIELRYDDGTDDTPGSGPTLATFSATDYQYLGVRFQAPGDQSYEVQSASWFSDFWVWNGMVDVTVMEWGNPGNTTTASVNVTGGGTWEVEFATPICIPQGGEYSVMLCPQMGVWGVVGEDLYGGPDGRSYFSNNPTGCNPTYQITSDDWMIWSCVTPCCDPSATENVCWGAIKSLYR